MGSQYNKVIKARRRKARLKRKDAKVRATIPASKKKTKA